MKIRIVSLYLFLLPLLGFVLLNGTTIGEEELTQNSMQQENRIQVKIASYFNNLRNYKSRADIVKSMDTISTENLKTIAKNMYVISEADAEEVARTLTEECKLVDSLEIEARKNKENIRLFAKPTLTRKHIFKEIKARFAPDVFTLVFSDYLLKVEIKSINKVTKEYTNYKLGYTEPSQTFIEVQAVVDEIIKGNSRFSVGQQFTFFYHPFWRNGNSFQVGETCLIPLAARVDPDWQINSLALITTLDSSQGRYPVVEAMFIDQDDHFGYGQSVPWDVFSDNILNVINDIKSW